MRWGGSVCGACGSVSVTELPTLEDLAEFYHDYNTTYTGGGRSKGARHRQTRYAKRHLRTVMKFKRSGRLIDIGSSTSPFPNYAAEAGYRVTVVDYEQPPKLSRDIRFIQGTLNTEGEITSRAGRQYDVVSAIAVLEHSRDPRVAIQELSDLCAPDGVVYVVTPQTDSFVDRNALGRTRWFYPPEHLHLISRKGMTLAFRRVGCDLVRAWRVEISPIRWLARYGLALAEGVAGLALRVVVPGYWGRARESRLSFSQEIAGFLFRRQA